MEHHSLYLSVGVPERAFGFAQLQRVHQPVVPREEEDELVVLAEHQKVFLRGASVFSFVLRRDEQTLLDSLGVQSEQSVESVLVLDATGTHVGSAEHLSAELLLPPEHWHFLQSRLPEQDPQLCDFVFVRNILGLLSHLLACSFCVI